MRLLTAGSLVRAQQGEPFSLVAQKREAVFILKKNIVFLANSQKRALLKEFVCAYGFILSKHSLFAPFEDAYMINNGVGLPCASLLSASAGGYRQIISKLKCKEIDLVVFFRGTYYFEKSSSVELELLSSCDFSNIPIATNIMTAEILLHALNSNIF